MLSRKVTAAESLRVGGRVHALVVAQHQSYFLFEAFDASSYTGMKHLCLEGLVGYVADFGRGRNRKCLWLVAQRIEDPSLMAYLGECLRGVGAEGVAELLDGVPEAHALDIEVLKVTLSGPPK